jgi:hypothetical protein
MKKFWWLSLNLLVAVVTACQPVTQSTEQSMLKPGDEIEGMIITTGAAKTPPLQAFCPTALENDGIRSVDCQVPQLPRLAIGHTFGVADQALQTLDWSALTWELDLDGHLLDLESFGTYDYVMPDLAPHPSPIREVFRQVKAWDVILINPTPGRHTLHSVARAETDTYGWVVNFNIEGPSDP